jgi:hypothetical protein
MNPKKTVSICVAIVMCFVVLICGLNFSNNDEDYNTIISSYNKTTQDYSRTSVSTVVNQISNNIESEPNIPGVSTTYTSVTIDTSSWLAICDSVHKQWGAAGLGYKLGGYRTLNFGNGDVTIRLDCSGYVSYCLYVAGYTTSTTAFTTSSLATNYTSYGLVKVANPGEITSYTQLQPGDILDIKGNHMQIYAGPADDWYNWGGESSTSDKYTNVTDIASVDSQIHSSHSFDLTQCYVFRLP